MHGETVKFKKEKIDDVDLHFSLILPTKPSAVEEGPTSAM